MDGSSIFYTKDSSATSYETNIIVFHSLCTSEVQYFMVRKQQMHFGCTTEYQVALAMTSKICVCVCERTQCVSMAASTKAIKNRLQEATVTLTAANETSVRLFAWLVFSL